VTVDLPRRQVEIRVPHSAWKPAGTERIAAAAGLWDRAGNSYLVPRLSADGTHASGAIAGDPTPSAFFDSAFRSTSRSRLRTGTTTRSAIADGDLSPFFADVDFGKLAAGADDESGGPDQRIRHQHLRLAVREGAGRRLPGEPWWPAAGHRHPAGRNPDRHRRGSEGRPSLAFGWPCRDDCVPDLPGRLQRYMVYLPEAPAPERGYASLVWTNGYALRPGHDVAGDRELYRQFAERPGNPTMVIDVDARGQDEWGYGESGAAVFEAIAVARRHYDLDPVRTAMGGFSSGAYMANKLSLSFPDVFSKAFICAG
jgi:hypothetical protein